MPLPICLTISLYPRPSCLQFSSISYQAPDQMARPLLIAQEFIQILTVSHFYNKWMIRCVVFNSALFPFQYLSGPLWNMTVMLPPYILACIHDQANPSKENSDFSCSFNWLYETAHMAIGASRGRGASTNDAGDLPVHVACVLWSCLIFLPRCAISILC